MSNFTTEKIIFNHIGRLGLGPRDIESNNVYRVEEYLFGEALLTEDL